MEKQTHENQPGSSFIAGYRSAAARRARPIALLTAAACLIGCIAAFSLKDVYSAKAMIVPVQEDKGMANAMLAQLGGLAGLAGAAAGSSNSADLYVTMLRSETVRNPIIDRFDLMKATGSRYRGELYAKLDKRVALSAGRKDGVVSIAVQDSDPKRAAAIANAYVEELQKLTVQLSSGGAGRNRSFLEERLYRARRDLAAAEENLKGFVAKTKAVNIGEQTKATIEGVATLRAQLAVQEGELSSLRRQYTDRSQEVKQALGTVANLRSQIAALEGTGAGGALPAVGSVPALSEQYVRLMRELKIQESMVELLTKQAEMAKLGEAKDVAPVQVLQWAGVPDLKSGPRRGYIIVMTTLLGFLAALLGSLIWERCRTLPGAGGAR